MEIGTRVIDLHCHPNTNEWHRTLQPYFDALRIYWHHDWKPKTEEEIVQELKDAGVQVLLVAFDAETAIGTPKTTNDHVASLRRKYPDTIIQGWASVDPWKGKLAIQEAERAIKELGLIGVHFHPVVGQFAPDDKRFYPLWEKMVELKAPVMIDTGFTGMGAGVPGGMGGHLKYAKPFPALDDLAADFPDLTIIAAHPAWPWTEEMIAIALHKANVYWELSGWGPKYFPDTLKRDISRRLQDKIMFGSDYPSITHKKLIQDWESLGYKDEVLEKVFYKNAQRVLQLE